MKPTSLPINVTPLSTASIPRPPRVGRPSKLVMPPLPQEILDGMKPIEIAHFEFFRDGYLEAYVNKYGKQPTPTAQICIVQASLDYINLLRLQAEQMKSGNLVSQARQHPGVQVRAWLQSIGLQEKDYEEGKKTDGKDDTRAMLLGLSERRS